MLRKKTNPNYIFRKKYENSDGNEKATLRKFIKNSYQDSNQRDSIGNYKRDDSLSGNRVQVYYNDQGKAIVTHTGSHSATDWVNNVKYAFGGEKAFRKTARYKYAKDIQQQANEKYGAENISTVGHSAGALLAKKLGGDGQIYTLNRPVLATTTRSSLKDNIHDIRSNGDLVSMLNPLQPMKNRKVIQSNVLIYNPLTEHTSRILTRDKNKNDVIFE